MKRIGCWLAIGMSWLLLGTVARGEEAPGAIFDMEAIRHKPTEFTGKDKQKHPAGTAELVDGKFGKAVKFSFVEGATGGFMVAPVKAGPEWDQSAGISFWVKGDGSSTFGGIELIDKSNYSLRYGYCFPIDSTQWKKITVPWRDFIPELSAPLVDPNAANSSAGYKPSGFGNFWFGKWFYWREYPANSYAIDQVMLEKTIEQAPLPQGEPGIKRFVAKLREKKPVTIVTMGDSLTDTRHWANRKSPWTELLPKAIEAKYGSKVTLVNPAMGGTTLSQNLIVMPRWAKEAPTPDLVLVWFGGNDWDSNVRGERYGQYLRLGVERIRRQTGGSADILIMTTCPGAARWETYRELEDAAKQVAGEAKTALVDLAGEFRKAGTPEEALKRTYWAWDKVHLGAAGHELVCQTVMGAIGEK